MGMSWAPPGLGFNTVQNPRYYSNPQGATVPYSLAAGTPYRDAQRGIQSMLRAGNASALDAYFANWKPPGTIDPKWMKRNWLQAYMAFPGAGNAPPAASGLNATASGVPWVIPPSMSQWAQDAPGSGPLLPSTGRPMY